MNWRERVWADISQRPFRTREMVCIVLFLGLGFLGAFYLGAYKLSTQTYDPELGRIIMIMGPLGAGYFLLLFFLARALLFLRGPSQPRQGPDQAQCR